LEDMREGVTNKAGVGPETKCEMKARHVAEYLALRTVAAVFRMLPYRAALAVAWCLAWVGHHVVRYRVETARLRIRSVFGDSLDTRGVRRVAWLSWRNFVFGAVDLARVAAADRAWIEAAVENTGPFEETANALKETGKGAILASPHMGAWDLAGVVLQRLGVPIFFIAAPQKNPLVDRFLGELRGATGVALIARGSAAMRTAIERLRGGQWMAMLPDVRAPAEGVSVRFLGGAANVYRGMAVAARRADVPIVVGIAVRRGWARHAWRLARVVRPDHSAPLEEDIRRMTQEVFDEIEKGIRDAPEQWFWYNKRWILDPLPSATSGANG